MADWIGWLATAIFVTSYFFRRPATLRRIQGLGALTWLAYGVAIQALPVIVANVIVAGAAIWSSFLRSRQDAGGLPGGAGAVVRTWRGATQARDADTYLAYLKQTGLKAYRETGGNLGAACLRLIVGDRAEFVVVSLWTSREVIRAFAGTDIERAVFYPQDDAYLVDRDLAVGHYDLVFSEGPYRRP